MSSGRWYSHCCRRRPGMAAAGSCPTATASPRCVHDPNLHPWALLPARELGCGSATTAWRRLEDWERAGVFDQLSLVLLDRLGEAGRIDLGRVSVDSASLRALKGGRRPAQIPSTAASAGASCTWPATTVLADRWWCC